MNAPTMAIRRRPNWSMYSRMGILPTSWHTFIIPERMSELLYDWPRLEKKVGA